MYFFLYFWGEFHLWGVLSLRADDDTLVSHTGRGSFSNRSPNLIVRNVPSGSQRTWLPHLSSVGKHRRVVVGGGESKTDW